MLCCCMHIPESMRAHIPLDSLECPLIFLEFFSPFRVSFLLMHALPSWVAALFRRATSDRGRPHAHRGNRLFPKLRRRSHGVKPNKISLSLSPPNLHPLSLHTVEIPVTHHGHVREHVASACSLSLCRRPLNARTSSSNSGSTTHDCLACCLPARRLLYPFLLPL
jgi:hypothetical protein